MSIALATALSLLFFVIVALVTVYVLGMPWSHGWRFGMQAVAWEKRLVYAGGLATLSGAVIALVVNYRKQRDAEDRRFGDGFAGAARQLGDSAPAVRMAGVYGMVALADRYPDKRQQCIDVLCGYLRLPYDPQAATTHLTQRSETRGGDAGTTTDTYSYRPDDREVRLTIIRSIRDHLRSEARISWRGCDFDFTGAMFDGGDFTGAIFSGGTVSFDHAEFSGGTVDFEDAVFSGGTVSFDAALFSGGLVHFFGATFSGATVRFRGAAFCGSWVSFNHAKFLAGWIGFFVAEFSDGSVSFDGAEFAGGMFILAQTKFSGGTIRFDRAKFSGCEVGFYVAEFAGSTVSFDGAKFSGGRVGFEGAAFSGGTVTRDEQDFRGWPLPD